VVSTEALHGHGITDQAVRATSATAAVLSALLSVGVYVALSRYVARLHAQTATLGDSARRHQLLFERAPLPMWVYDADTLGFVAVNDAAVASYGWSREQFLG
jgi:PAS domain-containing protein